MIESAAASPSLDHVQLLEDRPLVVRAGRLIDGTGRPPIEDAAVVVVDQRIIYAGAAAGAPTVADAETRDYPDQTLLPGLMDAHAHLVGTTTSEPYRRFLSPDPELAIIRAALDAAVALAAGFTTIRDLGLPGPGPTLKAAVEHGVIVGPRILTAVAAISQTGGHADWHIFPYEWVSKDAWPRGYMVDGVDGCRKAVRLVLREGADVVKVFLETGGVTNTPEDLHVTPEFADDELRMLIDEAHRRRTRVAAHAKSAEAIRRAVEFGIDTIEHGDLDPSDDDIFALMAERGTFLVPTLSLYHWVSTEGDRWGIFEAGREAARQFLPRRQAMVAAAARHGVKICAGTDTGSGMGLGQNAKELELLVEAGLSPMEAIGAATRVNAEAFGIDDDLGTLVPGKLADMLVVAGDPLADIGVLRASGNPVQVFKSTTDVFPRPR